MHARTPAPPSGIRPRGRHPCLGWLAAAVLFAMGLVPAWGAGPVKLTLQLKWYHQFQFAGYYAAQIKGFYRAEGLEVTLRPSGLHQLPLPLVESGEAEFGVSDMEVFTAYLAGEPVVALGVVFQHSPTVIVALRRSGIHQLSDLAGRTVMFQGGQGLTEIQAMLQSEGLPLASVKRIPHSWNLDDLLQGRVDALSAYATNEPYTLKRRGAELTILRPIDYGVDFYGDLLFTTRAFAAEHPDRTEAFRRASFQGWEYAMEHPEEIIDYILTLPGVAERGVTRDQLRFEAAQMRELVLPGLVDIGHMNPGRFRHIAETSERLGMVKAGRDPEGFIYATPVTTRQAWVRVVRVAFPLAALTGLLIMIWITQLRRTVHARTRALREEVRQRQQTEQALRESEARYRSILNASPDDITITDLDGRVLLVSPMAIKLFRCEPEELVGHLLTEFVVPEDRERTLDTIARMFQGVMPGPSEYHGLRPDGSLLDVEVNVDFIRDEAAQPTQLVLVVRDITERRRLEQERHLLQSQLQQAQKMESLGSLAGGVAHDMNNVLGAILGMASLHGEQAPPGSHLQRGLETITKAAERGGKMVKSLLNLARQSPAEAQALDLNGILREEVRLLERTTLSQVSLEMDLAPDLKPMLGDAAALTHAFMNLCVNAVDAMAGAGTLTLRTRNAGPDTVEVQIQDTGCGMSREVREKALDPFFTTKAVGKGTGLGLSIVYSTVKAHQGRMELQSEPGRGTVVRMRFPACASTPSAVQLGEAKGQPDEAMGQPAQDSLSVLLVDDDELVRHSIQAILEALGHQVTAAARGEEALERVAACAPDVVILDLNMPGLGGAGTLPRLRALRPDLPILLATGRTDQTALDLVEAYPNVTLLSKPFGLKELQRQLEPFQGSAKPAC
jgi:PAS domain S-box-containing protein